MKYRFAIVLLFKGKLGGAERRYVNLFRFLYRKFPDNFYLIVSHELYAKLHILYEDFPAKNVLAIGKKTKIIDQNKNQTLNNQKRSLISVNNSEPSILHKTYKYIKNYRYNKNLFLEIKKIQKSYNINSFLAVFNGILPFYFYFKKANRPGIIFSNMDSWFMNISANPKADWYRKYSLFNYAHEHSDYIDFLSPFILDGIKQRGIKIRDEQIKITRSSFSDYSKCHVHNKDKLIISFASRMEKDKNPILFVKASLALAKEFPDVEFHIMGDGRLTDEIKTLLGKVKLKNIIFHHFHPNPKDIFAKSSVFVSIQSTNNYPSQSVLEAMACGNAIIASDVGDTRMFVNEQNGTLIKLNEDSLILAIRKYIITPSLAKEQGIFASKFVRQNFTKEKAIQYYLELFEEAVIKTKNN